MMIKGKVIFFDIVYLVGVFQLIVLWVLCGSLMVNVEICECILCIVCELNYKVDKNVFSLCLCNVGMLVLLFFEDLINDDLLINLFFYLMLGLIICVCVLYGQDLLVLFQQLFIDWQVDYEDSNKVDGIILFGYGDYYELCDCLQWLVEQGMYFVCWGVVLFGQFGVLIGSDNFQGGYDIIIYLLQQGCCCIVFFGYVFSYYFEFQECYRGYVVVLYDYGLVVELVLQYDVIIIEVFGQEVCQVLLVCGELIDVICVVSDLIVIGVMCVLCEVGLCVLQDVVVIGFDDILLVVLVFLVLIIVQQDIKQVGQLLVECLLVLIGWQLVDSQSILVKLVVWELLLCGQVVLGQYCFWFCLCCLVWLYFGVSVELYLVNYCDSCEGLVCFGFWFQ